MEVFVKMLSVNRTNEIKLRLTSKERKKFDSLWDSLQEECNISSKRQSEIIVEGFFQYAEQLLSSYVSHTHTKSQSLAKQRKDAIFNTLEEIKEKGFMSFLLTYSKLILENDCFFDVKMRSRCSNFQSLLQNEDLYFINIAHYFDTQSKSIIYAIHRQSKWFPQLKDLCFQIKNPLFKLTHDLMNDSKLKDQIFMRVKKISHYKSNLDRAERVMLNLFLHEIQEIVEKPMYDQTDIVLREVIQLRSELRFREAKDLLELEKKEKHENDMKEDSSFQFITAMEEEE